jgi:hypothetical protein
MKDREIDYGCAVEQVRRSDGWQCSRLTIAVLYLLAFGIGYVVGLLS